MATAAEKLREEAAKALEAEPAEVEEIWMATHPETHQLHREDVYAISTDGAREHVDEAQIGDIARRFMAGDWGDIEYEEDREQNRHNIRRERGIVMGVYTAPDGKTLWALQHHRYVPPTIMLPEEH